jgi:hypothetical protein
MRCIRVPFRFASDAQLAIGCDDGTLALVDLPLPLQQSIAKVRVGPKSEAFARRRTAVCAVQWCSAGACDRAARASLLAAVSPLGCAASYKHPSFHQRGRQSLCVASRITNAVFLSALGGCS